MATLGNSARTAFRSSRVDHSNAVVHRGGERELRRQPVLAEITRVTVRAATGIASIVDPESLVNQPPFMQMTRLSGAVRSWVTILTLTSAMVVYSMSAG